MKLSHGCGYALHAIEYLASRPGGRPAAAHEIAREQGLPRVFLAKALVPLVRAGLLLSLRGPNGGCRLGRPAARITLLEVVEAVDGPLRGEAPRVGELDARLRAVCERAAEEVRRRLGQIRLSDLVGGGRRRP
jgi:Rrf2 family protein